MFPLPTKEFENWRSQLVKNCSITRKTVVAALNVTAHIARQILVIRDQKVMLDADLAARFPDD
jgi:hypothetical protein